MVRRLGQGIFDGEIYGAGVCWPAGFGLRGFRFWCTSDGLPNAKGVPEPGQSQLSKSSNEAEGAKVQPISTQRILIDQPLKTDVIAKLASAIALQPNFDTATLFYIDSVLQWRREIGFFNHVFSSYARNMVVAYICFLHFANPTGKPEDGATYSRVWEIVDRRKDCGSRALRTFLTLATLAGYFIRDQSKDDKRVFAYVPSPKLLAQSSHHFTYAISCFDILLGTDVHAKTAHANPRFHEDVMASSGAATLKYDIAFAEPIPHGLAILNQTGGLATMVSLARAQIANSAMPTAHSIAKSYKVSATQARNVMNYMRDHKLIMTHNEGGVLSAAPIAEIFRWFLSRELALYAKYTLGLEQHFMQSVKI